MTRTPYSTSFSHRTNTWCNIQWIELPVMQFSLSFYEFPSVVPHIFSAVFSGMLNAYSFLIWRDKLHTHIDQEEVLSFCVSECSHFRETGCCHSVGQHYKSNCTCDVCDASRIMKTSQSLLKCNGTMQNARHVLRRYFNKCEMLMLVTAFLNAFSKQDCVLTSRDHSVCCAFKGH